MGKINITKLVELCQTKFKRKNIEVSVTYEGGWGLVKVEGEVPFSINLLDCEVFEPKYFNLNGLNNKSLGKTYNVKISKNTNKYN